MGFVPKMRQECAMGVALLDDTAQGMEKGSLDTLNYLYNVDTCRRKLVQVVECTRYALRTA